MVSIRFFFLKFKIYFPEKLYTVKILTFVFLEIKDSSPQDPVLHIKCLKFEHEIIH